MSGLRWLCHLSRHCLPMRPGRFDAINDHFFAPYFPTSSTTFRSSSAVHGPLTKVGLRTFCHLCRHCTSLRPGRCVEISFQFFAPCSSTACLSVSSSCFDHLITCFLEANPEELGVDRLMGTTVGVCAVGWICLFCGLLLLTTGAGLLGTFFFCWLCMCGGRLA